MDIPWTPSTARAAAALRDWREANDDAEEAGGEAWTEADRRRQDARRRYDQERP